MMDKDGKVKYLTSKFDMENQQLTKLVEIAESIAGKDNHHFKFIQVPFNIDDT